MPLLFRGSRGDWIYLVHCGHVPQEQRAGRQAAYTFYG